ncbi:MAG: hypothetical protein KDD34_08660 [Bdellovibrionales bacterium]|nr:hypothetical protein [Bdellovibrionales bacterium]
MIFIVETHLDQKYENKEVAWIDLSGQFLSQNQFLLFKKNQTNLRVFESIDSWTQYPFKKLMPVAFLFIDGLEQSQIELLESKAKIHFEKMAYVFISNDVNIKYLESLLNTFDVLGVITKSSTSDDRHDLLARFSEKLSKNQKQLQMISKFKEQNRQLEHLTIDLESLVKERTQDIQASKTLVEQKVSKVRQLISFIKNLSSVREVEDLVLLIRDEIYKVHPVGEPYLAFESGQFGPWILYFQRGKLAEIRTSQLWNTGVRLRINESEDQQFLANIFSRPFQRVISLPLQLHGISSKNVVLFIEHQLNKNQIDEFIEYMGERLQSLSLALDRSLLDVELKRASYLWESTFDSIDDPIAIFDQNESVIRSNQAFQNTLELIGSSKEFWINNLENSPIIECINSKKPQIVTIKMKDRIYTIHSYPIAFYDDEPVSSVVCHFVDVTNYKNLQSTMIQN